MLRKIIHIEESRCNGCGLCIDACHEGALRLINGKARLISDAYCDGLGACLPECPTGAIRIEERESVPFDEELVNKHLAAKNHSLPPASGCPGSRSRLLQAESAAGPSPAAGQPVPSALRQWPCQLQLISVQAPYFTDADLLVAADCTAYAYANLHADFMTGKVTLIGCPKLDHAAYADKLTAILQLHSVRSLTLLRMEVPCCGGLAQAAEEAVAACGKAIPLRLVTIGIDGHVLADSAATI
ncbi:ATP-binding protein [Propionispora vibrioides]|uniref:4Fe-4S dicluster domain-containing protein n=1 Tax=Propionispora vibrioides TaxID=112903 RepID=A0A1H8TTM6_9FIRM|nr:4Fe-4S binding protein [Propionispora vibrioides]SEO94196.1 4Fe-4S dicluster domain-containing protein [Propionispora vibrioides]